MSTFTIPSHEEASKIDLIGPYIVLSMEDKRTLVYRFENSEFSFLKEINLEFKSFKLFNGNLLLTNQETRLLNKKNELINLKLSFKVIFCSKKNILFEEN